MDSIIQAIDLVRSGEQKAMAAHALSKTPYNRRTAIGPQTQKMALDLRHLEKNRIISHGNNAEAQFFDVLRTHLLQDMDKNGWQYLAVTSPTSKCGKSTVACNLATSIARLSDRAVLLVDLNFRNPSLSKYLGIRCAAGVAEVLDDKVTLDEALVDVSAGATSFAFLPAIAQVEHSSDLLSSQSMVALLQILRREFANRIVIFDLPEVFAGDDVMSILPQMDAVMLVLAMKQSSIDDVRECKKYIEQKPIARVVVNKVDVAKVGDQRF